MIPKMAFGRTGHQTTRTLFGGAAFYSASQEDADRTFEKLLTYGVNHIDTAASYGDAELRIGPWMDKHRKDFFLATKTEKRTRQEAREELYRSLERLRVDHVDLWQLHNLIDPDEWQVALGPDGALEAAVEARQEGLVRYIGVTGHTLKAPQMHMKSLEKFDFDSVLLPYNYILMRNPQYAQDFKQLVSICEQRGVAVQTIKGIARRLYGDGKPTHNTWYQPLEDDDSICLAAHWVLSHPRVFLNTAADINLLPKILEAASHYKNAPDEAEMQALVMEQEIEPMWV